MARRSCSKNAANRRRGKIVHRVTERRRVERVEQFESKLEPAELTRWNGLEEREIEVNQPGRREGITPEISEADQWIAQGREYRRVAAIRSKPERRRIEPEIGDLVRWLNVGSEYRVRSNHTADAAVGSVHSRVDRKRKTRLNERRFR